jgi:hypothetical protein
VRPARDDPPVARSRIPHVPLSPTAALAAGATALLLALTGCGGSGPTSPTGASATAAATASPSAPAGPPSAARVIREWADRERRSDVAGAAAMFALPAIIQVDPAQPAVTVTRRSELVAFNASLPCGATILRTERRGAYVETLFRLVSRPGVSCDGPGAGARAAFRIRGGRITEWRRRLDDPTDTRPTTPAAPGNPGHAPV